MHRFLLVFFDFGRLSLESAQLEIKAQIGTGQQLSISVQYSLILGLESSFVELLVGLPALPPHLSFERCSPG